MKVGGRRNYGYGKRLSWAGKNALLDRYGTGCFSTRASHEARWRLFAEYAKSRGVKDARDVTRELIVEYGESLGAKVGLGELSVRYGQNLLSSVNVVMETMRGDRRVRITPAALVGQRKTVRCQAPNGLDRSLVERAMLSLEDSHEHRVSLIAGIARELGLRFREACLLDNRQALRDLQVRGAINITAGTKGGRGKKIDRWVPVSSRAEKILIRAAYIQGVGANLIPSDQSYRQWRDHAYHVWRRVSREHGLRGFHDLRAAYACERYSQITGYAAPAVAGHRGASKDEDVRARKVVAHELGHGRVDVISSYLGSAR